MKTLEYHGRPMAFDPINTTIEKVVQLLFRGTPQVVALEPGDATRYTLLMVPLGNDVAPFLDSVGIPPESGGNYLFVSALSDQLSRGEWLPFGAGLTVGTYDLANISENPWSQEFLAWWFTTLYEHL